ncbi:hypothetical protein [Pseudidiomarina insulisalsae]|uniref:Uncharacterized protein n=1 Tax=Pseudidiomarina insulisalsae TaxID=575789 RepID=A0A432YLU9_9GAMM|nr:hypothetical protein [Pseudidiomarina insulisalsae]RUO61815.1 hypothetical protein CWI71_05495 [Pseudidiomarina insulisalsae]
MKGLKKTRKVVLYRGDEAVSNFSQHITDSLVASLRSIRREFKRNPTLTHAIVTDSKGRKWTVSRNLSDLGLLWLAFRIK